MADSKVTLVSGQQRALLKLINFVNNPTARIFILKGYAGTGKTTLMKALIEQLRKFGSSYRLLASTGRAAKILKDITGESSCSTIHGLIYKYEDFNQDLEKLVEEREQTNNVDQSGQLLLLFEAVRVDPKDQQTHYYIIDEASMVSDTEDRTAMQATFGSGRLLSDLLRYDDKGKFIFVGDNCQLPPINQQASPALSLSYFKRDLGIEAEEAELTEVVRQAKGNDIVVAAQKMRRLYTEPQPWKWAKFPLRGYRNIHLVGSQAELLKLYIDDIKKNGYNTSTMIGTSNRQCDMLTQIIRPALGMTSSTLAIGDLLLVTQNNYISGLMNGDIVQVIEMDGNIVRCAGLSFVYVTVKELYTGKVYSQLLILDIIYANQVNLSQVQQKELFVNFYIRMRKQGIKQKSPFFRSRMMDDPYLNALRCVYGYVLTCHKSQGGEWNNVYLDIPRNFPLQPKPYVYQWVYTAMTRAKKELYVVNDFYIM